MKNSRRDFEIRSEDFDSFFLWKVFWKLIKQESPLVFFFKVFLVGAGASVMLFSFCCSKLISSTRKQNKSGGQMTR